MKHWSREESKERFPKPISPLGWSLLHVPLEATLARMSETLGVRKYARNEMIIWENFIIYTRKDFFSDFKNLKFEYSRLAKLIGFGIKAFAKTSYETFRVDGTFKNRFINQFFINVFEKDIVALINRWPAQIDNLKAIMGRDFKLETIKVLDYESFVKIREQMQKDSKEFFAEDFNVYFLKKLLFELLKSQLMSGGVSKTKAFEMLSLQSNGLAGNFSVEMIEDFNNQSLSTEELKKRYGHLTDNWDLYAPTIGEIESVWQNRTFGARAVQTKSTNNEIEKVIAWNPKAAQLISWLQQLVIMDEDLRAYSSLQYPQARKLMKMVEKTPAFIDLTVKDDSVYFLHLNEIEFGLKKSAFHQYFDLIRERKIAFQAALTTAAPFELFESVPGNFKTAAAIPEKTTQTLKGSTVSSGSIEGVVVHINDYADLSKITKKSIIVLESATPVYAPFYALSGGIISEMGGHLSHGAIVAREYGIPMLTGVENVCVILKEGQSIYLDADKGTIKVNS